MPRPASRASSSPALRETAVGTLDRYFPDADSAMELEYRLVATATRGAV